MCVSACGDVGPPDDDGISRRVKMGIYQNAMFWFGQVGMVSKQERVCSVLLHLLLITD